MHLTGNIPNVGFISGATEGMRRWNDATDTTSQPGTTSRPPYVFQPTGSVETADVVIEFTTDNNRTTSATYDPNHSPPRIYININHPNWQGGANLDQLAGAIGHELGHDRGQANAYPANSGCNHAATIMRGASHTNVHDRDVFQMNQALHNPGGCCADANNTQNTTTCVDGDADSVTTCDGDCDDNDPNITTCEWNDPCSFFYQDQCAAKGGGYEWNPYFCTCDPFIGECGGGWNPTCTPVVVDVAGDGFNLVGVDEGVGFDLNGDGRIKGRLSWTAGGSDDALALDRDGNGLIDDGRELFGNFTPQPPSSEPHGFRALALFDQLEKGGDGDGVIGPRDSVFPSLRLWQDVNHNGVSEADEMHPLAELGIELLSLDHRESRRRDQGGNVFRYRAKIFGTNDRTLGRWAYDVFLVSGR